MAKVGQVEKLNSKGMLAWEVDGVLARLTRGQTADGNIRASLKPLVTMGAAVLSVVRERVQEHGRLGEGSFPGYSARGKVRLSRDYAHRAGVDKFTFGNSAKFHTAAGTVLGSFSVTGGMWGGVVARGMGRDAVRQEFAGSTPGRGKLERVAIMDPPRTDSRRHTAATRYQLRMKPANTPNRAKAAVIEGKTGINVLRPTLGEERAMQEAVTDAVIWGQAMQWVNADSPRVPVDLGGNRELRQRINQLWV